MVHLQHGGGDAVRVAARPGAELNPGARQHLRGRQPGLVQPLLGERGQLRHPARNIGAVWVLRSSMHAL